MRITPIFSNQGEDTSECAAGSFDEVADRWPALTERWPAVED
jgi:hypothetical protein